MSRYTANVSIQFTTPCFCSGFDQTEAEIRVPSIRGQLRWWYRAFGAKPDEEAELFGSIKKGLSKVKIRINIPKNDSVKKCDIQNLPSYLWHFVDDSRKAIPAGTKFKLLFSTGDEKQLLQVLALTALWIRFGSLGGRSTRAAGCMKLLRIESPTCEVGTIYKTAKGGLNDIWEGLKQYLFLKDGAPRFQLHVCPPVKNASGSLKVLNNKWWNLRVNGLQNVNRSKGDREAWRAAFGLPVSNEKNEGKEWTSEGTNRLTSPFHIRPILVDNGSFYPAVLIFVQKLTDVPGKIKYGDESLDVNTTVACSAVKNIFKKHIKLWPEENS